MPLNATAVAPVKFAPFTTTVVPAVPVAGVKPVIRGATVKLVALVAVPPGVVTAIGPVVALAGTVAVICVLESTWKVAAVPLNLTQLAPVNPVPVSVTPAPAAPLPGVTLTTLGLTRKVPVLVAVPAVVLTVIFPAVAPAGTVAVILVGISTVKVVAGAPLTLTDVAPVKLAPVMVTLAPIAPLDGVKLVIRGATVKLTELVAVPPRVVTVIGPPWRSPGRSP